MARLYIPNNSTTEIWYLNRCEELAFIYDYDEISRFIDVRYTWKDEFEERYFMRGDGLAQKVVHNINTVRTRRGLSLIAIAETDVDDYARDQTLDKALHRRSIREDLKAMEPNRRTKVLHAARVEIERLAPPHKTFQEWKEERQWQPPQRYINGTAAREPQVVSVSAATQMEPEPPAPRCQYPGCDEPTRANSVGKYPKYCPEHRTAGRILAIQRAAKEARMGKERKPAPRCQYSGCDEPTRANGAGKYPKYCLAHRAAGRRLAMQRAIEEGRMGTAAKRWKPTPVTKQTARLDVDRAAAPPKKESGMNLDQAAKLLQLTDGDPEVFARVVERLSGPDLVALAERLDNKDLRKALALRFLDP